MTENLIRFVIEKKVRAKCTEIRATANPEEKMRIALKTIYDLHDFVGERPPDKSEWQIPNEDGLWCDLYDIVKAATKLLVATALESKEK